jgi:hypothetical protein
LRSNNAKRRKDELPAFSRSWGHTRLSGLARWFFIPLRVGERLKECLIDRNAFGKGVRMRTLPEDLDRDVGENGRLRIAVVAHVHRKYRSIRRALRCSTILTMVPPAYSSFSALRFSAGIVPAAFASSARS